ncbi:MAG: inosine monophosphate cyclohydrolase [Fibrobacter sp.]|nr:inosine monophosphate cyclohydrolase [Fibrobacter sp.]
MNSLKEVAQKNMEALQNNPYPGRGIVLGCSPDANNLVQVYWIMGRSENSRNRIFELEDNGFVRTKAYDESKVTDPSLIIYHPAKHLDRCHIISNGDQTDTVFEAMQKGKTMEFALELREFEPDAPNYTPRITGIMDMMENHSIYRLSILKTMNNNGTSGCLRHTYSYEKPLPGLGHLITTYQGDGDPLPSFEGEPKLAVIKSNALDTLEYYWDLLNPDNKISLMVKWINRLTFEAETLVINKHQ